MLVTRRVLNISRTTGAAPVHLHSKPTSPKEILGAILLMVNHGTYRRFGTNQLLFGDGSFPQ